MHNRVGKSQSNFAFGATGTTAAAVAITEEGWVGYATVVVPNFTNSITVTVTVKDKDGNTVWTKGTIAKNATAVYGNGPDAVSNGKFPIQYGYTVEAVLSGNAGGTGGTVIVNLFT